MQKSNEDCYYFLTSTCAKGPTCPYRHNPTVLTCNVICPAWSRGNCIDPSCPLRHSAVQRPAVTNGMTCYYENTPIGCRKLDCTFVHIRPRPNSRNSPNLRSSTTNLVNKDTIKPTILTNPPISTINESVPTPQIIPTPSPVPVPKIETPPPVPVPKVQAPPPVPVPKVQAPPPVLEIVPSTIKPQAVKQVIPVSSDDTKVTPSRLIVNRNVVIAEPENTPNRKVVQGTTNRIVVSSVKKPSTNDSDSDLDDLIDDENHTNHTNPLIDIPFPCSVPSITNRLFTSSTKPSTPANDTKPIRLNRDRLPVAKPTNTHPISAAPSNGEQTSAGTDLTQNDERLTNRLERFKKKPISPPRSVVNTTSSVSTRNGVNTISNERKRPAPEQIINESTPSKRLSGTIGDLCSPPASPRRTRNRRHHHHRRPSSPSLSPSSSSSSSSSSPSPPPLQRKSSPRQAHSTMNEMAWNRQVDEFLAKTKTKPTILPQPVPLLSLRPRYIPPSIPQQQQQQQLPPPLMNLRPRLRQPPPPPSVVVQKPQAPVITPPAKPIEPIPPVPVTPKISKQQEEEDRLLELDKPSDVVDTFAFIDEALFEADEFLELM